MDLYLYDFDGTLCKGDTLKEFWLWSVKRNPLLLVYLPYQLIILGLRTSGLITNSFVKKAFMCFLPNDKNKASKRAEAFWKKNKKNVFPKVKKMLDKDFKEKGGQVILISASPDFMIAPIAKELGFKIDNVIATVTSEKNAKKFLTKNCRGQEKVSRLLKWIVKNDIDEFVVVKMVSDSAFDKPLYDLADNCYKVSKDGKVTKGQAQHKYRL